MIRLRSDKDIILCHILVLSWSHFLRHSGEVSKIESTVSLFLFIVFTLSDFFHKTELAVLHILLQSTIPLPRISKLFLFVCHFFFIITCVRWSQLDHSPFLYLQISPESLFSRTSNSSPKSWASIFCGISLYYWFQNPNTMENFVNKWLNIFFCFSLMFLIIFSHDH